MAPISFLANGTLSESQNELKKRFFPFLLGLAAGSLLASGSDADTSNDEDYTSTSTYIIHTTITKTLQTASATSTEIAKSFKERHHGLSGWAIFGIVVGSVFGFAILASIVSGIIMCCMDYYEERKEKKMKKQGEASTEPSNIGELMDKIQQPGKPEPVAIKGPSKKVGDAELPPPLYTATTVDSKDDARLLPPAYTPDK